MVLINQLSGDFFCLLTICISMENNEKKKTKTSSHLPSGNKKLMLLTLKKKFSAKGP